VSCVSLAIVRLHRTGKLCVCIHIYTYIYRLLPTKGEKTIGTIAWCDPNRYDIVTDGKTTTLMTMMMMATMNIATTEASAKCSRSLISLLRSSIFIRPPPIVFVRTSSARDTRRWINVLRGKHATVRGKKVDPTQSFRMHRKSERMSRRHICSTTGNGTWCRPRCRTVTRAAAPGLDSPTDSRVWRQRTTATNIS